MKILVETSARHLHVSRADFEVLFGKDAQLTNKKDLSQPGQFACFEKVLVVGPKGELNMSILGPERPRTQIEVSFTILGISYSTTREFPMIAIYFDRTGLTRQFFINLIDHVISPQMDFGGIIIFLLRGFINRHIRYINRFRNG